MCATIPGRNCFIPAFVCVYMWYWNLNSSFMLARQALYHLSPSAGLYLLLISEIVPCQIDGLSVLVSNRHSWRLTASWCATNL
jgi:hypothetical protein